MNEEKPIVESIKNAIKKSSLGESALDEAERIIDEHIKPIIDSKIAEQIPGLRILLAIAIMGKSYHDLRLIEKLSNFLKEADCLESDEIEKFLNSTAADEEKTGKRLLDSIDGLDSDKKAKLVGAIFKYCARHLDDEGIDFDAFYRLVNCIDRIYYEDLYYLRIIDHDYSGEIKTNDDKMSAEIIESLFIGGLLTDQGSDNDFKGETLNMNPDSVYRINKYGKIIAKVIE